MWSNTPKNPFFASMRHTTELWHSRQSSLTFTKRPTTAATGFRSGKPTTHGVEHEAFTLGKSAGTFGVRGLFLGVVFLIRGLKLGVQEPEGGRRGGHDRKADSCRAPRMRKDRRLSAAARVPIVGPRVVLP